MIITLQTVLYMTLGTGGFNTAWYFILITFIMYCIMPVPLQWCLLMCSLSAVAHLATTAAMMADRDSGILQFVNLQHQIFYFDTFTREKTLFHKMSTYN